MAGKPNCIDDYLANVSEDKRSALQELRETIRSLVPEAEEGISYGLPAFRLRGKAIAGFGAGANHLSYYPMSGATTATLQQVLAGYPTSKGAIRFEVGQPLPEALVRKLVEARIAEL